MQKEFFVYSVAFAAVAPGLTAPGQIIIQADADFETQKLTFTSDVGGAAQTLNTLSIPKCNLLITDTGSGRNLMNKAIDLMCLFGNAQNPFILSVPKIFRANTSISFALTNYSAAETYNLQLSLIGAKLYR